MTFNKGSFIHKHYGPQHAPSIYGLGIMISKSTSSWVKASDQHHLPYYYVTFSNSDIG